MSRVFLKRDSLHKRCSWAAGVAAGEHREPGCSGRAGPTSEPCDGGVGWGLLNGASSQSPPVKRVAAAPCNSPWGHQPHVPSGERPTAVPGKLSSAVVTTAPGQRYGETLQAQEHTSRADFGAGGIRTERLAFSLTCIKKLWNKRGSLRGTGVRRYKLDGWGTEMGASRLDIRCVSTDTHDTRAAGMTITHAARVHLVHTHILHLVCIQ